MCSGNPQAVQVQAAPSADIAALTAKLSELERKLANGTPAPSEPQRAAAPKREPVKDISTLTDNSDFIYIEKWFDVIDRMRTICPALAPPLTNSYGYDKGGKLVINTKETLIKVLLKSADNKAKILEAVKDITGLSLSTVLTGFKDSLDRSGEKPVTAEKADIPPEQKLDFLIKKAEDGGIPIDTV